MNVNEFEIIMDDLEDRYPLSNEPFANDEAWSERWFDLRNAVTMKLKNQYQVHDIEEYYKDPEETKQCRNCGVPLINGQCHRPLDSEKMPRCNDSVFMPKTK